MLSKFLRPTGRVMSTVLVTRKTVQRTNGVRWVKLIPPSQYDIPLPKKLQLGYVMKVYWETIPLFITTGIAVSFLFFSIFWACKNKIDVVFTSRSRETLSRTMDLRNPTVHKLIIINQRYEPWPEMQDVLDKMRMAEKRAQVRAMTCSIH